MNVLCNEYSLDFFLKKSKLLFGDRYDYSKVDLSDPNLIIICPVHGEFRLGYFEHLRGIGCLLCGDRKCISYNNLSLEEFVEKASIVHNYFYDYSKVNIVDAVTKVTIICPIHGEFFQSPSSHLYGRRCRKCANIKIMTTDDFIKEAKLRWGDRYSYSKTHYLRRKTDVLITCSIHGDFSIKPYDFLYGQGCPYCIGDER